MVAIYLLNFTIVSPAFSIDTGPRYVDHKEVVSAENGAFTSWAWRGGILHKGTKIGVGYLNNYV